MIIAKNKKNIAITRMILYFTNMLMIIFISTTINQATYLICEDFKARDFLEKIKYLPMAPWKVPVYSIFLLFLLFLSIFFREKYFKKKIILLYFFTVLDIFICIQIMYILNFSYKGIIFLLISNIIIYIDGNKKKLLFLVLATVTYIFLDYDIISIKINIFSVNDYIQYFSSIQKLYLYSIKNILSSINEVVFILLMIFIIQTQIDENNETRILYEKLYKTTEELKIAYIQLEDYTRRYEDIVKLKERNRIAREIHDTVGHALTAIATGLEACTELIVNDIEKTKYQLIKITDLSRKGLLDIRRSVNALRPDSLDRYSLIPALEKLVDDINVCTNIKIYFKTDGEFSNMDADEEEIIYRIIQESITNSVRHGNSKEINIVLKSDYNTVNLSITDNGIGCKSIKEGFGLKHIKMGVENLNGYVEYQSEINCGFIIKVEIPIRRR